MSTCFVQYHHVSFLVNSGSQLSLQLLINFLHRQTFLDSFVAAEDVAEEPHHLNRQEVLLVFAKNDVGSLPLRIEHPLLPLTCIITGVPSSQSMVLGMRTSLFFSDRIVKMSKKLVLESKCSRCSSLAEYIMINYHRSLGAGLRQPLLQVALDVLLHQHKVRQVVAAVLLEATHQDYYVAQHAND